MRKHRATLAALGSVRPLRSVKQILLLESQTLRPQFLLVMAIRNVIILLQFPEFERQQLKGQGVCIVDPCTQKDIKC